MWVKKKMWVVVYELADTDEDGELLDWTNPIDKEYCDTYSEAEKLRDKFLAGEDEFYGDLVVDCWISDEPEEQEIWE